MADSNPYDKLTFEDFRARALDPELSCHEKVGFPDDYREGQEHAIFADIRRKLPTLENRGGVVVEIGPGCGPLPTVLLEFCLERDKELVLIDSAEMLQTFPDHKNVHKIAGEFPNVGWDRWVGCAEAVIAYSVVQYPHHAGFLDEFVSAGMDLLVEGGGFLLGDIPNASMRARFFASTAGQEMHRRYTGEENPPPVKFDTDAMNDGDVAHMLEHARAQGMHAWVLPQDAALPMANRREDLLIKRPI